MKLPESKQVRGDTEIPPASARILLGALPKHGKSTLAGAFLPATTLIIDTQHGTDLLEGEHFVSHVSTWDEFEQVVDLLAAGGHPYTTVVLDMVDDLWRFADLKYAGKGAVSAYATDDYQKAIKTAEVMFQNVLGKLLATPMGLWALTHLKEIKKGELVTYKSKLDSRVSTYVTGAVQYVWIIEKVGPTPVLMTQPSMKFEVGSRTPMPDKMVCDARKVWRALDEGLNPMKAAKAAAEKAKAAKQAGEVEHQIDTDDARAVAVTA